MFRLILMNNILRDHRLKNKEGVHMVVKSIFSPKKASNELFKRLYARDMDWENPTLFDEKLMVLKCTKYYKNRRIEQCYDKIEVLAYVKACGLADHIIPTIDVFERPGQIKKAWDKLPSQFVLKYSKGSGTNLIVSNKEDHDVADVCKKFGIWMKYNYGYESAEFQGLRGKKRILCQQYIGVEDELPVDYKFYCLNGKPVYIMLVEGRCADASKAVEHKSLDSYLNLDYTSAHFARKPEEVEDYWGFRNSDENYDFQHTKPKNLAHMIRMAEILAKPFPFVRVDLFEHEGRVYFGELTFTPFGCMQRGLSDAAQEKLGKLLRI